MGDFEDAYDPDYMDETVAEAAAEMFLSDGGIPDNVGIDIKELIDLLPNDLYEMVVEKMESKQSTEDEVYRAVITACENVSNNAFDYKDFDENAINR